jgi:tetratricopeptide (TPR) repeat protein
MSSSVYKSRSNAEKTYKEILAKFPNNKKAIQAYQRLKSGIPSKTSLSHEPPKEQLQELIRLHKAAQFEDILVQSEFILKLFPKSAVILNIIETANSALKRYEIAIAYYCKTLKINPRNIDIYNNMGDVF